MVSKVDIERLGKTSRRTALVSFLGLLMVIGALVYSALKLYSLQNQIQQQSQELEKLRREHEEMERKLRSTRADLEEATRLYDIRPEDLALLKDLGTSRSNLKDNDLKHLIDQCHKAIEELQKIKSTTLEKERRSAITLKFFPRRGDENRLSSVINALKEYGFNTEIDDPKELDTPTNAIWLISQNVMVEDFKIIALNLIRFGIQVRFIGPYPEPQNLKRSRDTRIYVGADPDVLGFLPLNVEDIRDLSLKRIGIGVKKSS